MIFRVHDYGSLGVLAVISWSLAGCGGSKTAATPAATASSQALFGGLTDQELNASVAAVSKLSASAFLTRLSQAASDASVSVDGINLAGLRSSLPEFAAAAAAFEQSYGTVSNAFAACGGSSSEATGMTPERLRHTMVHAISDYANRTGLFLGRSGEALALSSTISQAASVTNKPASALQQVGLVAALGFMRLCSTHTAKLALLDAAGKENVNPNVGQTEFIRGEPDPILPDNFDPLRTGTTGAQEGVRANVARQEFGGGPRAAAQALAGEATTGDAAAVASVAAEEAATGLTFAEIMEGLAAGALFL